jgi:acyl dehydratase
MLPYIRGHFGNFEMASKPFVIGVRWATGCILLWFGPARNRADIAPGVSWQNSPPMNDITQLHLHVGQEVGVSPWFEVGQARIDQFADAIVDPQWIHINPERARRESPYGGTIAHGFLTLSLLSHLLESTVDVSRMKMGVNYGLNRVRFTDAVPAGSRIRGRFVLAKFENIKGGTQLTWGVTVEREGTDKPACVAEWVTRQYG